MKKIHMRKLPKMEMRHKKPASVPIKPLVQPSQIKPELPRPQVLQPKPEQPQGQIKTSIDSMLREIRSSDASVTAKDLSEEFSLPRDLVVEWLDILEHKGLIEIIYPPFGAPRARAASGTKTKEKNPERRDPSRKPTVVIAILLAAVLLLFILQASKAFDVNKAIEQSSQLNFTKTADLSTWPGGGLTNVFDFEKDSATYTASIESGGVTTEHKVYLNKGKARVELDSYSLVFDGNVYAKLNPDNTTEKVDKSLFDTEAGMMMPWTYLDKITPDSAAVGADMIDGKSCTDYSLTDGSTVCVFNSVAFPLRSKSGGITVIFKDLYINPTTMPEFFPE